ncbi:division/cell wall cluster transcriptional repressor MraZ [Candidatus Tenderia electrophaga]|uniref:Transcriptional regulator MraZ n=1 Tax=Candidatus Tenderia electrophaga TaxID=1748243 RepID=A0A0S2TB59_9GAMM|nr:division/cell wall cluster transcriptional repressor MraZ [Candidatus Tenderia electrophaga]
MFRGVTPINVDAKGRMAIPAKYRERLQELCEGRLVLTVDFDKCLMLFPESEWEQLERKLSRLPSLNPRARRLQRLLMGYASECEVDGNGRILLPAVLREYAQLDKRIVLVGQGNKFEIWNEEIWNGNRDEWLAAEAAGTDAMPEELENLSF